MKILHGCKIELDPNNRQKTAMEGHGHAARFAYNWGLARWQELHAQGQKTDWMSLRNELVVLKAGKLAWLKEYSKCAPESAFRDLGRAFQNFFQRIKKAKKNGVKPGFPRFKSRHRCPLTFKLYGTIQMENRKIKLPRIGWVRLKESGRVPVDGQVKSVTIRQTAGRWFASALIEKEKPEPTQPAGPVMGVDLGISHMATLSDGTVYENPKPLKKLLGKLRKLSKRLSRKKKGSKNRQKAKARLQRLHRRIADIRLDALHRATTDIVRAKRPSHIALEDLNVSGMMRNRKLSRAISDVGMYEFRRQVEYKARLEGIPVVIVDRFFPSSKTCNACGVIQDMPLSERVYRCGCCGHVADRDLNAARNLARMITVGSTDSACGGDVGPTPSADPRETGSGQEELVSSVSSTGQIF